MTGGREDCPGPPSGAQLFRRSGRAVRRRGSDLRGCWRPIRRFSYLADRRPDDRYHGLVSLHPVQFRSRLRIRSAKWNDHGARGPVRRLGHLIKTKRSTRRVASLSSGLRAKISDRSDKIEPLATASFRRPHRSGGRTCWSNAGLIVPASLAGSAILRRKKRM